MNEPERTCVPEISKCLEFMGVSPSNRARWITKNIFEKFREGQDYKKEVSGRSKVLVHLHQDLLAYIVLHEFKRCSLEKKLACIDAFHQESLSCDEQVFAKFILELLDKTSDLGYVVGKIANSGCDLIKEFTSEISLSDNFEYFRAQLKRISHLDDDIPEGFTTIQNSAFTYRGLRDRGYFDKDNKPTEKGKPFLLPRFIVQSDGYMLHYIISEEVKD